MVAAAADERGLIRVVSAMTGSTVLEVNLSADPGFDVDLAGALKGLLAAQTGRTRFCCVLLLGDEPCRTGRAVLG
eukprot:s22_g23.t1